MQYVLVVQSEKLAKADAAPFIPDSLLLVGLHGVQVFGPYPTAFIASEALRMFPSDWGNLKVCELRSTLNDVSNPYLALQELKPYEREDRD